jgi:hypothetical protein
VEALAVVVLDTVQLLLVLVHQVKAMQVALEYITVVPLILVVAVVELEQLDKLQLVQMVMAVLVYLQLLLAHLFTMLAVAELEVGQMVVVLLVLVV